MTKWSFPAALYDLFIAQPEVLGYVQFQIVTGLSHVPWNPDHLAIEWDGDDDILPAILSFNKVYDKANVDQRQSLFMKKTQDSKSEGQRFVHAYFTKMAKRWKIRKIFLEALASRGMSTYEVLQQFTSSEVCV